MSLVTNPWRVSFLGHLSYSFETRLDALRRYSAAARIAMFPWSAGRVVSALLQCTYHAWSCDGQEICRAIPALCGAIAGEARRVPTHVTCEQQGYVWVYGAPNTPGQSTPSYFEYLDDKRSHAVR
jgi:phenylpropionate dioxygenase-like ring-hydroxylating dioxygenase large terminal subunit